MFLVLQACRVANEEIPLVNGLIDERRGHAIRLKQVLISPEKLTWDQLVVEARKYLADHKQSVAIEEVLFVSNRDELRTIGLGTRVPEGVESFADTLRMIREGRPAQETGLRTSGAARLLIIGNSALLTLRYPGIPRRDRPGLREEVIAGTIDPTRLSYDGQRFRLLRAGLDGTDNVTAYLKAEEPASCEACRALATVLSRTLRQGILDVQIRQDTWFASPSFPRIFRFEPDNSSGVYRDVELDNIVDAPGVATFYAKQHVSCRVMPPRPFACVARGIQESVP